MNYIDTHMWGNVMRKKRNMWRDLPCVHKIIITTINLTHVGTVRDNIIISGLFLSGPKDQIWNGWEAQKLKDSKNYLQRRGQKFPENLRFHLEG